MIDEIPNYSKLSCLYRVFAECDVSVCFLSRERAPGCGGEVGVGVWAEKNISRY